MPNRLKGLLSYEADQPQQLSGLLGVTQGGMLGYPMRQPFASEDEFFKSNPHVGGMAAEDNQITLNPYTSLSKQEQDSVAKNEALRLYMREKQFAPRFDLTQAQREQFKGTPYEAGGVNTQHTLLARMLTGDPSAQTPNFAQSMWANKLLQMLKTDGRMP